MITITIKKSSGNIMDKTYSEIYHERCELLKKARAARKNQPKTPPDWIVDMLKELGWTGKIKWVEMYDDSIWFGGHYNWRDNEIYLRCTKNKTEKNMLLVIHEFCHSIVDFKEKIKSNRRVHSKKFFEIAGKYYKKYNISSETINVYEYKRGRDIAAKRENNKKQERPAWLVEAAKEIGMIR